MSGMYDEKSTSDITLSPFQASARGVPVGRATDPVAFLNAGEQRAREFQVSIETVKHLRRDVITCYRKEGTNHYAKCREQVDAYVAAISDPHLLDIRGKQAAAKAAAE